MHLAAVESYLTLVHGAVQFPHRCTILIDWRVGDDSQQPIRCHFNVELFMALPQNRSDYTPVSWCVDELVMDDSNETDVHNEFIEEVHAVTTEDQRTIGGAERTVTSIFSLNGSDRMPSLFVNLCARGIQVSSLREGTSVYTSHRRRIVSARVH